MKPCVANAWVYMYVNLQYIVYGHNSIRVHYIVVCEQVPIVSHIYVTS